MKILRTWNAENFSTMSKIVSCRAMPYPDGFFNHTVPMSGDRPQYMNFVMMDPVYLTDLHLT